MCRRELFDSESAAKVSRARLRALASHELYPDGIFVLTADHHLNRVTRIQGRFDNHQGQIRLGSRWSYAFIKSDGQTTTTGDGNTAQLPACFIQCQSTFRDFKSSKLTAFRIHGRRILTSETSVYDHQNSVRRFYRALALASLSGLRNMRLFPEHQSGNGGKLHVGCALINGPNLGITEILLDWIVFREAVSAIDFYCERGHLLRHL